VRRIIQIAASASASGHWAADQVVVLCDDGSLWALYWSVHDDNSPRWVRLRDVPQDGAT
jgi:hypothetical protein